MKEKRDEFYPELTASELLMRIRDNRYDYVVSFTEVIRTLFVGIAAEYVTELSIPVKERMVLLFYFQKASIYDHSSFSDISNRLGFSRSSVISAVNALAEKGFIIRVGEGNQKFTDLSPTFRKILQFKRCYSLSEEKLIKMLDVYRYLQEKEGREASDALVDFLGVMFSEQGYEYNGYAGDEERKARDFVLRNFLRFCLLRGFRAEKLTGDVIRRYCEVILSTQENREKFMMDVFALPKEKLSWEEGLKAFEQRRIFNDGGTIQKMVLSVVAEVDYIASSSRKVEDHLLKKEEVFFKQVEMVYKLRLKGSSLYERIGELAALLKVVEKKLDEVFKRFERELTML